MTARVVLVVPTLVGGGAERVVRAVADGLAASSDLDVEVISLLDGPEVAERTEAGVQVRGLGARRVRAAMVPLLRDLRSRPPVAVLSTLKHVSIGLGLLRRLLPDQTKHVARIANTYSRELATSGRGAAAVQRLLIRASHRSIDEFICVSAGVRNDLVSSFGVSEGRCVVVPNPVDVDRLADLARQPPPGLDPAILAAPVRFLAVGRLEVQKDHATLLRAFAEVRRDLDAALVIVGEGSLRARLGELAHELGITDRVAFVGFVANPYPLFRLSHVLVLSSRFEGMPNVLLEALALGVPCVATDCPHGPSEVLVDERLGLLVPVGDVARLRDAMIAIATRPDPEVITTAGPAHVLRHHSPTGAIEAYRRVLVR